MSTFDGIVSEFPHIRIDYFRHSQRHPAPLALFLSHVHSDHLLGLEACKSPFIYCSPATRDLLLRLEKYNHRMNFSRGILEARRQTYRHLKNLLKPIPLGTPTEIQLAPGISLRVTLIDANHCVGAVMFLIQGDGKAVLYTGDIRAEPWWVDSLTRHPNLIPFTVSSDIHRLDNIYLDTTFATKESPYREFPPKAEGMREMLSAVARYPPETLFYFDAWTFGYEQVWQALSSFLGTQVHVDDYRYGLYRAMANGVEPKAPEAAHLVGFSCGNHFQEGCLTRQSSSRLHSCEKGTGCEIWNRRFVRITPIVSRHNSVEITEVGAGGGHGDLNLQHELELGDTALLNGLQGMASLKLRDQRTEVDTVVRAVAQLISGETMSISMDMDSLNKDEELYKLFEGAMADIGDLPIDKFVPALARILGKSTSERVSRPEGELDTVDEKGALPQRIRFPYSRHSSYNELCNLIGAFKPRNIHPCTVDSDNWSPASSMAFLFGHLYDSPPSFTHDQVMLKDHQARQHPKQKDRDVQLQSGQGSSSHHDVAPTIQQRAEQSKDLPGLPDDKVIKAVLDRKRKASPAEDDEQSSRDISRRPDDSRQQLGFIINGSLADEDCAIPPALSNSICCGTDPARVMRRQEAYNAALGINGASWADVRLISVSGHQMKEEEL